MSCEIEAVGHDIRYGKWVDAGVVVETNEMDMKGRLGETKRKRAKGNNLVRRFTLDYFGIVRTFKPITLYRRTERWFWAPVNICRLFESILAEKPRNTVKS